jgi:hypothetical protein
MFTPELFLDIGRTVIIPKLIKEFDQKRRIGGAGEDAGLNEAPPPQFVNYEFGVRHGDFRMAYRIPQDTGFKIEGTAFAGDTVTIPHPRLADSVLFDFFFCADSGKIPACFFIFEGDIEIRPPGAGEDRKGKNHNKHSSKASGRVICRSCAILKNE